MTPIEEEDTIGMNIDYSKFDMLDPDLHQIKQALNLSEESISKLLEIEKSYEEYLTDEIKSCNYPYIKNAFYIFYSKLSDPNEKLYFLVLMISRRSIIEKNTSSFFHSLIKLDCLSLQNQYSGFFTKEVIESYDYKDFIVKMIKWHTRNEMIVFLLWILNEYFQLNIKFSERMFMLTLGRILKDRDLFLQKSTYYNSQAMSVPQFGEIMVLITSGIMFGLKPENVTKLLGSNLFGIGFGMTVFDYSIGKLSTYANSYAQLTEFRRLSYTVDQLNIKMNVIIYSLIESIKTKMKMDINNEDNNIEKTKELQSKIQILIQKSISNYCDIYCNEPINEEGTELIEMKKIEEEQNDWLIIDYHDDKRKDKDKDKQT